MELVYNYSSYRPEFVTHERHLGRKIYTINYNIEELSDDMQMCEQKYRYHSLTLPAGQYDRSTVISALIRQRYSDDEMQAIINNYLLDKKDTESAMEFNAMQEYRTFAKFIADQFLQTIQNN